MNDNKKCNINKVKESVGSGRFDKYFLMDEKDVLEYVKEKLDFFEDTSNLECKEIGDGNLNYVFKIVDAKSNKSMILKHSSEDTRAKSGRKLNTDRNILECKILQLYNKYCPQFAPEIYMYDEVMNCYAMEDLSKYTIMRTALLQNKTFSHFADNITTFMVNTLLPTTDVVLNHKQKKQLVKRHINPDLCDISEQLVFTDPFGNFSGENIVLDLMKEFVQENLYDDVKLRLEAAKLKFNFMNNAQALLHGDLHTGSIFINEDDIKVIDPEFAFYGPIGYDVGNVIANLFLAWGHGYAAIENQEERLGYLSSIEKCIIDIVNMFKNKFIEKFRKEVADLLAETEGFDDWYLEGVLEDTAGSVGLEIIRRIVGDAKVLDITSIKEEEKRVEIEKILILTGKEFIINRSHHKTGEKFIETLKKYSKCS
ncbi:S-methyl-5-thioribose kinase [Clostridium bovifaecis]|uniref:S-methyl-5-thioribose kinase n=1 Tax=Clostridium bovifaecis TaxID=2184719 RepID=A0A6I6EU44_9CLOT|nr:S-methyl-5-thioribose kinase [Clostridium bovifaecis]